MCSDIAARGIYEKVGYKLVKAEKHHSFGQDLIGETWELDRATDLNGKDPGFYPFRSLVLFDVVEIAVRRPSY